MIEVNDLLNGIARTLDGVDVAMCAFDRDDRALVWNRAFLRFFPEHAGHVFVGEPYEANLRRFYEGRLDSLERVHVEKYIEEGLARHRGQQRPYTFIHQGEWLQVASQALDGVGRVRIWRRIAAPPTISLNSQRSPVDASTGADERDLLDHVGDGVMLTSADNHITWVNDHFAQLMSLESKASAVGLRLDEIYRSAWRPLKQLDRATFIAGLTTLRENLRYAGAPFELPLPEQRWVRVVEQRRSDGVGFFAVVDISVFKTQQRELVAAERRALDTQARLEQKSLLLHATLARMEQGVLMVNRHQVVEVCNRRAIELLDLPPDLMASEPTFAQVLQHQWSNDEFSRTPESVKQFVRAGGILDQPQLYERERPNGTVIEVRSVPMEGGGVLRTYTDITERKRSEATRGALERRLREAEKLESIGTLAGGIAHDFNNVMAAILGNVAFAQDAIRLGQSAEPFLQQIKTAGVRARSLVQQILSFSDKQPKVFGNVPLQPLLEESLSMLRSTIGSAVTLQGPQPDHKLSVKGNPIQLQQVILNLGTNAWHSFEGSPGHIEIGLQPFDFNEALADRYGAEVGSYAHIWVRDNGCGMPQQTRERIFEPFFTTKLVGHGTGLGLSVAHGIVESHGGIMRVMSEVGKGSTFDVYLPLVDYESEAMPLDSPEPNSVRGQGQHVLYIDDDEVVSLMVNHLLLGLGYRVTCCMDPRDAIKLVAQDPDGIDIVVTDFNMPHLNGLEVVRALSKINASLHVAMSSGYITEELLATAKQLGVVELMRKENTLEELGGVIQRSLKYVRPPRSLDLNRLP